MNSHPTPLSLRDVAVQGLSEGSVVTLKHPEWGRQQAEVDEEGRFRSTDEARDFFTPKWEVVDE